MTGGDPSILAGLIEQESNWVGIKSYWSTFKDVVESLCLILYKEFRCRWH